MSTYGGVVEGEKDQAACEALIRRIDAAAEQIVLRVAGNRPQLMKKFPSLLNTLLHVTSTGGPVDKALVIRDADQHDVPTLEREMANKLKGRAYPFPNGVSVHAIREELDVWLLADLEAISDVAVARGGRRRHLRVHQPLESIQRPSALLQELFNEVGLNYTAAVFRDVAERLNLDLLRAGCPSFVRFEEKVRDP